MTNILQSWFPRSDFGEVFEFKNGTTIINDQEINDLGDLNDLGEEKIVGDKNKISITNNKDREGIQKIFKYAIIQDQELLYVKENQPGVPNQVHESAQGYLNDVVDYEYIGQKNTTTITNDESRLSKEKINRLLQEEIRHKVETEEHKKKVKMKLQKQEHKVCLGKSEMEKAHKLFDEMPNKNEIQDLVSLWIFWHRSPQATDERKEQLRI